MGDKHKKIIKFYLTLLVVFATIYAGSFLIADSYSYFTAEVEISGELVTEEDFGIPLPVQLKEEQVEEEAVKEEPTEEEPVEEQQDKKESTEEKEKPAEEVNEVEEPIEPETEVKEEESTESETEIKEEETQPESEPEAEVEKNEESQETSTGKEPYDDNTGDDGEG
ncbi:hypothetical protein LG311_18460 [Sutcliffiella horikoshii]|uniref:hypothetical protein n=1 Tax=Sutcliffiella horikoshii TaxID=79883 RepID=UPI00384D35B4